VTAPSIGAARSLERKTVYFAIQTYVNAVAAALRSPHRIDDGPLATGSARTLAIVVAFHVLLAAGICTLSSNWVYLAGKGMVLGPGQMDLGGDDLPPDTAGQVAAGLVATGVIWCAMLLLSFGMCVVVADWLYRAHTYAFRAAVRRTALATVWFVVWALITFGVNLERGGRLFHPARWPAGETWEARDRLIFLVVLFPIVWAFALRPVGGELNPRRTVPFVAAAVVLSWLFWFGLWRAMPWIAIEAYTG
jgi:hypothetical protein